MPNRFVAWTFRWPLPISLAVLLAGGGAIWFLRSWQQRASWASVEAGSIAAEEEREQASWSVPATLLVFAVCGATAGLLAGLSLGRRFSRSLSQLSVPVRDAADKLSRVVGPIRLTVTPNLAGLRAGLQEVAKNVGVVVEQLEQSQREVLRADHLAAVGQLAAGMAHEVLNPLTAMKILVEVAAEGGECANLKGQDLLVLHQEIMRMENLVQTFLDFARPPQPDMRVVDARELIDRTLSLVSSRAEQQGVQIEVAGPSEPVMVHVDPGQIRQVILNLLMNALDASKDSGTITIALSGAEQPLLKAEPLRNGSRSPEPWVKLCVCDTGPGLPRQLGQRIFDPFVSTKETGIGLGLSICARIVDAHGGRILASNGPEGGAMFTILLPPLQAAKSLTNDGFAMTNDEARMTKE